MTRIFVVLAFFDGVFLALSFTLGALSRWSMPDQPVLYPAYWTHFLVGLSGAILTLLVHCAIFIYFLGTGRWVKEIKYAYSLPDEPLPKLTRDLKRRVFPPALFAMLTVIAASATGAAVQVGLAPWQLHGAAALATLIVSAWAFVIEYQCLRTNIRVLDDVLAEIDRRRLAQGLSPNSEALEQEMRF
jgi:hypothetical protein